MEPIVILSIIASSFIVTSSGYVMSVFRIPDFDLPYHIINNRHIIFL